MLWSSAQNWDPVGVPAPGDKAVINPDDVDPLAPAIEPNQGPVVDSNMEVHEIRGPADNGTADQTMRVLAGDVRINHRWQINDDGAGTGTVLITGDSDVYINEHLRISASDDGTGILDISGNANVSADKMTDTFEGYGTGVLTVREDAALTVRNGGAYTAKDEADWSITLMDNAVMTIDDEWEKATMDDATGGWLITDEAQLIVNHKFDFTRSPDSTTYLTVDSNGYLYAEQRLRPDGGATINFTDNAVVETDYLKLSDEAASCYTELNISGNASLSVYDDDDDYGFIFGDKGTGELNISGNASMYVAEDSGIPKSGLAATFTLSGGEFVCDNEVKMPESGSCTFSMTGGDLVADELTVGKAGGTLAYMDGGLADVGEFSHEDNYSMDFTGGMLKIDGDRYDDIFAEVLAGRITGYGGCGGRGDIHIDYDNVSTGHTLVWATSNPYRAWDPTPVCGATDQYPDLTLMWNAGDNMDPTDLHHVFLSDDFDCVNMGLLICYLDDTSGTTMASGELQLATTYYWRVESHDYDEPRFTPGQVWSFSTPDVLSQDNMEDYDDVTNPIWDSWDDGCGDAGGAGGNGTGSCVYIGTEIYHNDNSQSMLFYYDNSGQDIHYGTRDCNYSIATHTFDAPQDWTLYGAETFELWFYGDLDNDATALEAMFVVVHDSDSNAMVVYGSREPESLSDMKEPEWQQWDIPLQVFADDSVDLNDVVAMEVGFGDRTNCHREPGGFGVMYIDDIALRPHGCIPKYTPDIYDINGDCVVDWGDVETYCDNYLTDER
jgi:hypothetical protein